VSRFLLVPLLARYLPVEEVGVYGLVSVSVFFALYALGLDFYVFNMRELIRREPAEQPRLMRDQLVLHAGVYAVVLPALAALFAGGLLPARVAPWFYALLVSEHLSMELQRWLFALSRPVAANWVLALRSGAWVFPYAAALVFWPASRALPPLFAAWLVGALASLAAGAIALRRLPWRRGLRLPVDRAWIASGLRVALPFLASSLSIRGITTLDRFALQRAAGEAEVGVYSIFFGLANLVPVLAETGFVLVLFPRLVATSQAGDVEGYRRVYRQMATGVLVLVTLLSVGCVAAVGPILSLIENPIYARALPTFWVLLAASVVSALGFLPHYQLYARRRDREIVRAAVAGFAVAVAGNAALVPALGSLGAALATLAAMSVLGGWKLLAVVRQRELFPLGAGPAVSP
jgi:O-antigen/teichoic acid export membrane protein